jgi:uncharacterized membrane protein
MARKISLVMMGALYLGVGVCHFTETESFVRIVPPSLPFPKALVYISGAAEILLAACLAFSKTRKWACYGIILLLVAIFPANIYMLTSSGEGFTLPHWILVARLPAQGFLIAWAYWHRGD